MLKVVGVAVSTVSKLRFDPYLPLELDFGGAEATDNLYWRMMDNKTSLLEVAISPKDGQVLKITLTSIHPEEVSQGYLVSLLGQTTEGVPRIDLELWPRDRQEFSNSFVDVKGHLKLIIATGSAQLLLGEEASTQLCCNTANVRFGTTVDGNLSCIEIALDSTQEALLLQLINSSLKSG